MTRVEELRTARGITALVFLFACLGFIVLAYSRGIASDEGFYAMASQRVSLGYTPYLDFFYPQAPVLPYLYGALFAIVPPSWEVARVFTALIASLSALFLFQIAIRCSLATPIAALSTLLFMMSALVINWFPTVKIFSITSCFLLGSLYVASIAQDKQDYRYYLVSGLLLGLACGIRSYVIVCTIPFILFFKSRETIQFGIWFILGLAIGLLPHAFFFLLDSDRYLYNNLGYHLDRSSLADHERLPQKLRTLARLFGFLEDRETPGMQYGLLVLCSLASVVNLRRSLPIAILASFLIGWTIFAISLLPTPTWQQYFSLTVPFFVLPIGYALHTVLRQRKTVLTSVLLFWALSHCITGGFELYAHITGQKRLPGPEKTILYPRAADRIGNRLEEQIPTGSTMFSLWPGHLFGTHLHPVAGMENQFWVRVPRRVGNEDRMHYHLMSPRQVRRLLKEQKLQFILSGKRNRYTPDKLLLQHGYQHWYQDPELTLSVWKRTTDS